MDGSAAAVGAASFVGAVHGLDVNHGSHAASGLATTATISLDQVMGDIGLGAFHWRLLLACGFGFSAAAIEVVLMAFLFPVLQHDWDLNHYELGSLPMLVGLGSLFGELFWGNVADKHGRRLVFTLTGIIVVFFGIASAFAQNFLALFLCRAAVGFGYGGNIAVDFTLFSELLPTQGRGRMLFAIGAFWPLGQILTSALAWVVIPNFGWRIFLVACAVPSLLSIFLRPLIPESPRWLLLRGDRDNKANKDAGDRSLEALEVLRHIAALNGKTPEEVGLRQGVALSLENESQPLRSSSSSSSRSSQELLAEDEEKTSSSPWFSFCCCRSSLCCLPSASSYSSWYPLVLQLFGPTLWRSTLASLVFVIALGMGSYGITTLMPTLLQEKGVHFPGTSSASASEAMPDQDIPISNAVYSSMLLNAVAEIPGILLAGLCGLYFGRKGPMQVALLLIAIPLLFFAMARSYSAVVLCSCLASCFMEFSWALFHVYTPEVFPTELRATALGFVSAASSAVSLCAPMAAAWLLSSGTEVHAIIFFSSVCAVGSFASWLFFHIETMDRDLADKAEQIGS